MANLLEKCPFEAFPKWNRLNYLGQRERLTNNHPPKQTSNWFNNEDKHGCGRGRIRAHVYVYVHVHVHKVKCDIVADEGENRSSERSYTLSLDSRKKS